MDRILRIAALAVAGVLLLSGCDRGGVEEPPASEEPSEAAVGTPLERGLQAHVAGDLEAAVAAYQEVLGEDPENHLALYNLGLVEQSRGNNGDAEKYYRRTIELDDTYTPAMFNLAILRTAEGDHEEAVELYERVVAIDDENAGAYLNMGFALRELGRDAESRDAFNTAIELDPSMQDRITGE